jgi:uncharacterized membrane protein YgdD (TMEM256/DUF423 family)
MPINFLYSPWLRETQSGKSRMAGWVWVVGIILFAVSFVSDFRRLFIISCLNHSALVSE